MKNKILVLVFAVLFANGAVGQTKTPLTVDCGENIVICPNDIYAIIYEEGEDTLFIGQNVKITGGVSPCTYEWSCKPQGEGKWKFTTSNILNDTTIRNPYFLRPPKDYICTFTLKVTDANGNVAVDSITILKEEFVYIPEYPRIISKENPVYISGNEIGLASLFPLAHYAIFKGDTVEMPTYFDLQKKDSIIICTIDSVGCYIKPVTLHYGDIWWTSIDDSNATEDYVKLISNTLIFNDNSKKQILIYSTNGILIYYKKTIDVNFELPNISHCICTVIVNNKKYSFYLFRP